MTVVNVTPGPAVSKMSENPEKLEKILGLLIFFASFKPHLSKTFIFEFLKAAPNFKRTAQQDSSFAEIKQLIIEAVLQLGAFKWIAGFELLQEVKPVSHSVRHLCV